MAFHNKLGSIGEKLATEYLITKGYIIRDVNWRSGKMELDIIAEKDLTLVIIEVKTRSTDVFISPDEAVTAKKIRNIIKATNAYIKLLDVDLDVRFDIITLVGTEDNMKLEHIEDAFFPPMNTY